MRQRKRAEETRPYPEHIMPLLRYGIVSDADFPAHIMCSYRIRQRLPFWIALRRDILGAWRRQHPGTRPHAWWLFDSKEPRKRLGGTGDPAFEHAAIKPEYRWGVPCRWLDEVDRWLIGKGTVIDPDDQPLFEAEARYLKRHKLLKQGEAKRLTDEDYKPQRLDSIITRWDTTSGQRAV